MPKHRLTVHAIVVLWLAAAAACYAGFSENPALPRLRPVADREWNGKYAMASTVNPGTFVVTVEHYDEDKVFDTEVDPVRWQDVVNIRVYCYETNSETSITLTTWKQGDEGAVVSGGFPPCYYWTWHMGSWPYPGSLDCHPMPQMTAYSPWFMEVVKVDITKDALPPAAGQTWGKLYATVNMAVTMAGGPAPENMLWAFEISRNAAGPTIMPVRCPSDAKGWTPNICDNGYWSCDGAGAPNITQGTYAYPPDAYPGLIRHTFGGGCNVRCDTIMSHCVTVNKRPGSTPTYEAWVWWYQNRLIGDQPPPFHKMRIFGYRLDSPTDQWTVLRPTVHRPEKTEPNWWAAEMDGCLDPVGGKIWLQISECDNPYTPSYTGTVTACWIPTNFAVQSSESAFYDLGFSDYYDTACVPVGGELLLASEVAGLAKGAIDSTWHSGSQGHVFGVFNLYSQLKTYRIANGILMIDPDAFDMYTSEQPDITCYGNPMATSQFGRSGTNYSYSNPHGAVVANHNCANIATSLFENSETTSVTLRAITKNIPLSKNAYGDCFSQIDLTKDNHWVKVSQVKKRLDQSPTYVSRDRELFYVWMGVDAQEQKVMAIKRSGTQAFRFGVNWQSYGFQWDFNELTLVTTPPYYLGAGAWRNGRYNRGTLAEFTDIGLPGFRSGDQIFNAIFEGHVASNELVWSSAYAGLVDNPTDPDDPANEGRYLFVEPGQTGWHAMDVSESWNYFRERPWGFNYFHFKTSNSYGDEGLTLGYNSRLWCYWLDWQ